MFTILPPIYFLMFIFPFPPYVNWNSYPICNRAQFHCNFHFLMWLLLLMPCSLSGPFIFRYLVYLYQLVDPGQVLCAGLILPCRSFMPLPWCCIEWPSAYLARWLPCICITAWLRLICVIEVVQCFLFIPGWPVRYWVWLTSMVLLLFHHTLLPTSMWRPIISPRIRCFQSVIFSLRWLKQLFTFGAFQGVPAGIFSFYSMPALLHLGISTTSGGLGVECLQPSLDVSGKLLVSSSCISSSSSVLVSGRTCQRWTTMFYSCGTMLDGGSLAPHSSHLVGRHSLAVSHHKISHHGFFGRPEAQGSAISAFNPLAGQQCVAHRQGFSSSVCQVVAGATQASVSKVYQQCWKEWAGWCA